MRLGIAAVLVLADPEIERVAGHERLDAAPSDRATIIERQVAVDDIRHEIGAPHREPADRVRLDVVIRLEEVVGAGIFRARALESAHTFTADFVGLLDRLKKADVR